MAASCTKSNLDVNIKDKEVNQVIENFNMFESNSGIKKWNMTAETAQFVENEKYVLLINYTVKFFNEKKQGVVRSVLTALKGRLDTKTNDFYTIGETTVTNFGNEILWCRDLRYVSKKERIFTDSKIRIERKDSLLTGTGLEATPDFESIIIKQNRIEVNK